jgi:amino acid adenylation domain-containing protein
LELFYEDGAADLLSHGHVPTSQLEQLELQLRDIIKRFSGGKYPLPEASLNHGMELSITNEQPRFLTGSKLLHEMIDQKQVPSCPAIEFWENQKDLCTITYPELLQRSRDLAARICLSYRDRQASAQPVIPLLIPQSPDLYVAMIAVLRAGCAFCPIQLDAPADRLRFIFSDISASVVITTPDLAEKVAGFTEINPILLNNNYEIDLDNTTLEVHPVQPRDCAYVMYTSGSTGQPKGVSVSHQAATQSLLAHERHIPQYTRFLQFAAPTFDVSLFEIFFTLARGCVLVSCDRLDLLSDLPAAMRRMNIDAAELTPTVAAGLLQRRTHVPSLKLLLTIGEMLTPSVIEEFGGSTTQESILWGMYGPTEAAIHCTLQPAILASSRPTNIGFPFDTVSAFVVAPLQTDEKELSDIKIMPLGQVGELAVGGYQLADGYLNRAEQTKRAFIDTKAYGRLYRTGDRARMLPNLSIECLGRISSGQIKLRGQRIELGEVQYAATRSSGCRDAVVMVVTGTLVAFCLIGTEGITADDILATCRQWLPKFMVPGDVILRTEYPCLPSGKVDRSQLEKEYKLQKEFAFESTESHENEWVKQICDVLKQTLGYQISPTASLAASGLDSLSAIQAASRLRERGFSLLPIDLLSATSVTELSADLQSPQKLIQEHQTKEDAKREVMITAPDLSSLVHASLIVHQLQDEVMHISACTPLQLSMLAETAKDPTAYCNMVEFQFPPSCKSPDIEKYLLVLLERNDILRSGFCRLPSSSHPFALVTFRSLNVNSILSSTAAVVDFRLDDESSLLRPLRFKISRNPNDPQCYTVLLQLHHALYDGWSIDLVLNDLDTLVRGEVLPQRPQFHAVVDHYAHLKGSSSLDYWQERMHEFHPSTMPNFNGRVVENSQAERQDFCFDVPLDTLNRSARALNVGPQTLFQGALAYILQSYLGTPDVTLGTVTSGRMIPVPGIEGIIGPCVTSLPLRIQVSHSKRVMDLVKSIHALNREMLQHADQPIRAIKRISGLTADENLWDVLFVWQETLESRKQSKRVVKLVDSSDKLESILTIEIEPRGNSLFGRITYHSSHIPKAQALLLLRQVNSLVTLFADAPETTLDHVNSKLPNTVLSISNPTPEIPTFISGLSEAVEHYARVTPDRCAVIFNPSVGSTVFEELTYRELNSEANRLSHLLRSHLEPTVELVCICMEKSLKLYVAILAVLKTGRGYLPITPTTPVERIKTILKEANITLCLVDSHVSSTLNLNEHCKTMDVTEAITNEIPDDNIPVAYDGSRTAYAVFTSGSTGTPKGVLVTQQNLLSNLKVLSELYPTSTGARLLQACSQAFDVSVFEILFSWYVGICLCSATNDVLFHDLEQNIRAMGITHLSLTPTVAALINPNNTPDVRFLVTAGEAVTEKVKRAWEGKGLYQGYGPSETTNICTVKPQVCSSDLINNIGQPLKNTSAFVCDSAGNDLLPFGALGELCFGGDQVFRGYLNNNKLTAKKTINHKLYGRLYRSGDTGRLLPGGSILFAGRIDDQVKIRGQRIELGEINRCLLQNPHVLDCVTLVLDDGRTHSERLVSFWSIDKQQDTSLSIVLVSQDIAIIIKSCFEDFLAMLPSYMVPTALVPITSIPMTTQGKVDKRSLQSLFESLSTSDLHLFGRTSETDSNQERLSKTEQSIALAVCRTANVPLKEVKRHTSFFNLGLDSISAISLSKALQVNGQPPFLVSTILKYPTVARLAKKQEEIKRAHREVKHDLSNIFSSDSLKRIRTEFVTKGLEPSKIFPCTPLQESMLSTSENSPLSTYCNTLLFKTRLDPAHLQRSWAVMASRHELLRTCFVSTDNLSYPFAQVVLSQHTPRWMTQRASDLSSVPGIAKATVADRLRSPLNSHEPPYFLQVIYCGSLNFLQFSCHHAIQDGAATSILLREIELHYFDQPLLKPVPYEPFLQEMVHHRSEEAIQFWTDKLQGFKPLLLSSTDHQRGQFSQSSHFPLSEMEKMCRESGVSLLALSQAAWAKVLHAMSGKPDICFGNVVSGRTLPLQRLENLFAPTFNTLPVRVNMKTYPNNGALLQFVQQNNADTLNFQLTPLRTIQSNLGFGGCGLFSTLLLLQPSQLELDSSIWTLEEESGEMDVRT